TPCRHRPIPRACGGVSATEKKPGELARRGFRFFVRLGDLLLALAEPFHARVRVVFLRTISYKHAKVLGSSDRLGSNNPPSPKKPQQSQQSPHVMEGMLRLWRVLRLQETVELSRAWSSGTARAGAQN